MSTSDPIPSAASDLETVTVTGPVHAARVTDMLPKVEHLPVPATALPTAAGAVAESSALGMGAFLASLRRRWAVALTVGMLVGGGAAAAVIFFLPPRFTVQTLLHVAANKPSVLGGAADTRADFIHYQKTQLVLVKSKLVLNTALRQPAVANLRIVKAQADPVAWLEKQLIADFALAPEVLRIAMTGDETAELAAVVNAVRDAYLKEIVNKEQNERNTQYQALQGLANSYEDMLKTRRRALKDLAQTTGSRNSQTLEHKHRFALERLHANQQELIKLQSQIRTAQIEHVALQDRVAGGVKVNRADVDELIDREQAIEKKKKELADIEEQLVSLRSNLVKPDEDPAVKAAVEDIAARKKAIEDMREKRRPEYAKRILERMRRQAAEAVALSQNRIKMMGDVEKKLKDEIHELEKDTVQIGQNTLEIETMGDDIAQNEEMAKKVGSQLETLKVELKAPSRVSLLEEAAVSGIRDEYRQIKFAGAAGGAGFLLAVLGVCWLDARGRRIGSPIELRQGLNLRLMGTLPNIDGRSRGGRYGQNRLLESVDAMRTTLLHFANTESVRSVMVTSALQGEGKTSLSGQLAASLARAGFRTLLVDADLRNPSAHKLFELPDTPGLAELLRGEATPDEVAVPTMVDGLWLIPAGDPDRQAIAALARTGGEVFRSLEERYDFVVVDSSPVLPVADAMLIGQQVDAVIFSVLRDVSRMPAVQAAYERMALLGFRVLGAAVSGVRDEIGESAY